MVFDTELSVYFWNAACIRTCHSGLMSWDVRNTSLIHWGMSKFESKRERLPVRASSSMSSSEYIPSYLATASK